MNKWNIDSEVIHKTSVDPQSSGAATVNGTVIDRTGYLSMVGHGRVGAVSGSPSTTSVAFKVQHGAKSDGTDMADFTDEQGNGPAIGTVTAATTGVKQGFNLRGAKQYIRIVATVSFTGGTSPAALIYANALLGGVVEAPAA